METIGTTLIGILIGSMLAIGISGISQIYHAVRKLCYRLGILKVPDFTNCLLLSVATIQASTELEAKLPAMNEQSRKEFRAAFEEGVRTALKIYLHEYWRVSGLDAHVYPPEPAASPNAANP